MYMMMMLNMITLTHDIKKCINMTLAQAIDHTSKHRAPLSQPAIDFFTDITLHTTDYHYNTAQRTKLSHTNMTDDKEKQ